MKRPCSGDPHRRPVPNAGRSLSSEDVRNSRLGADQTAPRTFRRRLLCEESGHPSFGLWSLLRVFWLACSPFVTRGSSREREKKWFVARHLCVDSRDRRVSAVTPGLEMGRDDVGVWWFQLGPRGVENVLPLFLLLFGLVLVFLWFKPRLPSLASRDLRGW